MQKAFKTSKITIKPVTVQSVIKAQATLQEGNQQVHRNLSSDELKVFLTESLGVQFLRAFEITSTEQAQFLVSSKGKITMIRKKVLHESLNLVHNRVQKYMVHVTSPFLHLLGITSAQGNVISEVKRKYLQINRFEEIFSTLVSVFPPEKPLHITDMGCGKGYLTFAMYDFLKRRGYADVLMTGVDIKSKVMTHCNEVAVKCKFQGLHFEENTIDHYFTEKMDVLVALHACDTATDDALVLAIQKKARLVIVAPCCQKQVRRSLKRETGLTQSLYEFGMVKEKLATLFTDLIRVNVLKYNGYKVKMQEFIGLEHTAKNVMISGEFTGKVNHEALSEIKLWMDTFGIGQHYLLDRLNLF